MQHLKICLPTDLPTTEAYFFSYFFKISCSCTAARKWNPTAVEFLFLFFKTELFIWFFVEESVAKGFIDGCVCDSSCKLVRRTTKKNILTLQSISLRTGCSSLSPQNEILLLFEGLYICILGRGKLRHGIQRKWKLNIQAFTAEYRKSSWLHLLAFKRCIQGVPE